MNSKCVQKILILVSNLVAQSAFSNIAHSEDTLSKLATYRETGGADANITGRYALPLSKVNIEPCQREALRLHPGVIDKQRTLHRRGDFLVRFQVQANDGLDWFMLCDLATGKIIEEF
jgi:hypothetical protein